MNDLKNRAAQGRALIENAIVEALGQHDGGLYNNELARLLHLESNYEGQQSNYLKYSILGGLLADGRVTKEKRAGRIYCKQASA